MRRAAVVGVVVVLLAGLALVIQQRRMRPGGPARLSAQEAMLSRQNEELARLTAAAEKGTLLDFEGLLVVIDQALVQDLLRAVTPLEADVGGGFHVRIDATEAVFGDGLALVRMRGTANLEGASVGAPVTVLGVVDGVEIAPASGVLRCDVGILGVEAEDAAALGLGDPLGRLTEALAHGGLSLLLGPLEIPVRVEDRLTIPEVTKERLHIAAERLPLSVSAQQVKVFGGRLWVFVDVDVAAPAKAPGAGP